MSTPKSIKITERKSQRPPTMVNPAAEAKYQADRRSALKERLAGGEEVAVEPLRSSQGSLHFEVTRRPE